MKTWKSSLTLGIVCCISYLQPKFRSILIVLLVLHLHFAKMWSIIFSFKKHQRYYKFRSNIYFKIKLWKCLILNEIIHISDNFESKKMADLFFELFHKKYIAKEKVTMPQTISKNKDDFQVFNQLTLSRFIQNSTVLLLTTWEDV